MCSIVRGGVIIYKRIDTRKKLNAIYRYINTIIMVYNIVMPYTMIRDNNKIVQSRSTK